MTHSRAVLKAAQTELEAVARAASAGGLASDRHRRHRWSRESVAQILRPIGIGGIAGAVNRSLK